MVDVPGQNRLVRGECKIRHSEGLSAVTRLYKILVFGLFHWVCSWGAGRCDWEAENVIQNRFSAIRSHRIGLNMFVILSFRWLSCKLLSHTSPIGSYHGLLLLASVIGVIRFYY